MSTFADPDIPKKEELIGKIESFIQSQEEKPYPWEVLDYMVSNGYDRGDSRKALRTLRMKNRVVPAGEFVGRIKVAETQ